MTYTIKEYSIGRGIGMWAYGFLAALLVSLYSCSSDDAATEPEQPKSEESYSVFTASEKPGWAIDWTWLTLAPSWEEPSAYDYECSMQLHFELHDELAQFSSDDDQMAVFINGTCRCVSYRNVIEDTNQVVFLLNICGDSDETGEEMMLEYYCAKLKQSFIIYYLPDFEPNNLWGEEYMLPLYIGEGSTKYPYTTELAVMLPDNPGYEKIKDDVVYIFVGEECRGILISSEFYPGFKGIVYSYEKGEEAEVRYYCAEKKGYYTLKQTFKLNNVLQQVNFKY
jgi:hypothetical protein